MCNYYLHLQHPNPRRVRYLRANRCGRDDIYEKGVYLTLCLWRLENFATFQITVKGQGNGRCPLGYVSLTAGIVPAWQAQRLAYISAWASALLVLTVMGNAKASSCGTSDSDRLPRFFVYVLFRLIVIDLGRGLPRIVKTLMVYEDNRGNLVHRAERQDQLNRRAVKEHPVGRSAGVLRL